MITNFCHVNFQFINILDIDHTSSTESLKIIVDHQRLGTYVFFAFEIFIRRKKTALQWDSEA